jgi:hypothetical protein
VRFAAKQKPHRPGIALALGLRAGKDVSLLYRGPWQGANHESLSVRDFVLLSSPAKAPPAISSFVARNLDGLSFNRVPLGLAFDPDGNPCVVIA